MALDNLKKAIPRQDIICGAAKGFHMDKEGNKIENKYSNWPSEADSLHAEMQEALRLFQIINDECVMTEK